MPHSQGLTADEQVAVANLRDTSTLDTSHAEPDDHN